MPEPVQNARRNMPFLWGVASSGYQCEGGYNGPEQPQNNWTWAEAQGDVARTGSATDFWHRYMEDFGNSAWMGLNAFRLSIEWARVQPTGTPEAGQAPDFDFSSLDHYADMIVAARNQGLEPVVTLHHFTHPAWLGLDAWLRDDTPVLFEEFVRTSVRHINARLTEEHHHPIKWFVTLNEPNMLVLNTYLNQHFPAKARGGLAVAVAAYNRLLAAHVRAYNAIHDLYKGSPAPMVTMNTFCSDAYWSENMLLDLLHMREMGIARCDMNAHMRAASLRLRTALANARLPFRSDPLVWIGRLFHWVIDRLAPRHATEKAYRFFFDELDRSPRACVLDYLGIDYYDPFTGHLFRLPLFHDLEFRSQSLQGHLMAGLSRKWWDWHMLPEGLHFFCKYYSQTYGNKHVMIAENGMAIRGKWDGSARFPRRDKLLRSAFLEAHVAQVLRLLREGIPVIGYLHWSITDNYEWGSYTPRFGLWGINYGNHAERQRTDSQGDTPSETYKNLIVSARREFPDC